MNTGSLARKLNTIKTLAGALGLAAAVETVLPGASLAEVERQLAALGKPRKTTRRGTTRRVTNRTAQARAQARALSELVSRANEPAEECPLCKGRGLVSAVTEWGTIGLRKCECKADV